MGPTGNLKFIKYEMGTGEEELFVVTNGWGVKQLDDNMYDVFIVEQAGVTDEVVYKAGRVRFSGKVFQIPEDGVKPPIMQPRRWIIRVVELRPQL
jgi:hypothetical protein